MAHTFSNLLYHVVWGTKDREPSIDGELRTDLHSYLGGIVRELNGLAIIVNGTSDHVHALLKLPPAIAVSDAIRVVKTNSSKWAHEQHGRMKFAWQSGYSAFSVSESGMAAVRTYIERQEEHHRKKTFAEEYLAFLKKNRVAYDPRYVFE
jgi:REP element-mobilizing transposase RayT